MLCQFSVKNFKSIKEEMTLDMQAAAITEHEDRVIVDRDGEKFLPISVIYGPNGGGKSNVLKALGAVILRVLIPIVATMGNANIFPFKEVDIEPFKFSKDTVHEPTEFEIFFRTCMAEYRYQLGVYENEITYENLDRIKFETGRRASLYQRYYNEIQLKSDLSKLKVSNGLSKSLPLLSYLAITYRNNETVRDVTDWFMTNMDFLNYGNPMQELGTAIPLLQDMKPLFLNLIKAMDLDIEDFRVEKMNDGRFDIYTQHRVGEYVTELNIKEESSGTKKIFGILPFIANSILNGSVLVIDELDAKLHPLLLQYIINMFNDLNVNKKGAQLIFTSHDLSTMNNEVFRRDEIWFVAKGNKQNSCLYSLVEFKDAKGESVRKDARFDKQYLEGRYGADPYLQRIIDWGNVNG